MEKSTKTLASSRCARRLLKQLRFRLEWAQVPLSFTVDPHHPSSQCLNNGRGWHGTAARRDTQLRQPGEDGVHRCHCYAGAVYSYRWCYLRFAHLCACIHHTPLPAGGLAGDDWFCKDFHQQIVTVTNTSKLLAVGYSAIALVMTSFGGGINQWDVPKHNIEPFGIVSTLHILLTNNILTPPDRLLNPDPLRALRVLHQGVNPRLPRPRLRPHQARQNHPLGHPRLPRRLLRPCARSQSRDLPASREVLEPRVGRAVF